jgi:putative endonuclease
MSNPRQRLGQWGEQVAVEYLIARGYTILERKFRTRHGELDIVAHREDVLIFVEIKTRANSTFAFPEDPVTRRKQLHHLSAAEDYLESHPQSSPTWQVDVISIEGRLGTQPTITHFENVFA